MSFKTATVVAALIAATGQAQAQATRVFQPIRGMWEVLPTNNFFAGESLVVGLP